MNLIRGCSELNLLSIKFFVELGDNMGISMGASSSSYEPQSEMSQKEFRQLAINQGWPDPRVFHITKSYYEDLPNGSLLVVLVNYPNCKNFEGDKILIFKDITMAELNKQKVLDPHFSNNKKFHSPIARFKPTDDGWILALMFIRMFVKYKESNEEPLINVHQMLKKL